MPMGVYDRSTSKPRKDIINMVGRRYGRLSVLSLDSVIDGGIDRIWNCVCDCGNHITMRGQALRSERIKSCGCYKRERMSNMTKKAPGEAARNSIYFRYRSIAKRRGLSFELSKEELFTLVDSPCFYCGSLPSNISKSEHNNGDYIYNGIDRKNNLIGYRVDNCVPCCIICNRAKREMPYDEFIYWIHDLIEHNSK